MKQLKGLLLMGMLLISTLGSCQTNASDKKVMKANADMPHTFKIQKSDAEWRKELTPKQYEVLREKGTERAWTGEYNDLKEKGVYTCAACGNELFSSETKFESGSGWPSFFQPIDKEAVADETDKKFGMIRTEVLCNDCGGHLGHVFNDGPKPTGLRYCINSVSLDFKKK